MARWFSTILLVGVLFQGARAQEAGMAFLKLGTGGRAAGMGEAYTALAEGADATYWNPAGLLSEKRTSLMLSHLQWIQDVRSEYVAVAFPGKTWAWGLAANSANVGGIELRGEQPSFEPIGTFDARYLSLGFFYARKLRPGLQAGVGVKLLYQKIYIEEAGGAAVDAGVVYRFPALPLRVAAALQHLGKMTRLLNESTPLPTLLRIGLGFLPSSPFLGGQWAFGVDAHTDFKGNFHTSWGAELRPLPVLALRVGYRTGYEVRSIQYGFGFRGNRFSVDYGMTPFQQDLGLGQRLSFTLYW